MIFLFFFFLAGAVISSISLFINFGYGMLLNIGLIVISLGIYSYVVDKALKNTEDIEKAIRKYKGEFYAFSVGIATGFAIFIYYASYQLDKALTHAVTMGF